MFAPASSRGTFAGPRWVEAGARRRRRRRGSPLAGLLAVVVLAAVGGGIVYYLRNHHPDERRAAALAFVQAWGERDSKAMYAHLDAASRRAWSYKRMRTSYLGADRAAGVRAVTSGRASAVVDGRVRIPISVRTRDFGTLKATMTFPVSQDGDGNAGVRWVPALRLPGLRPGEDVRRRTISTPARASVLGADGRALSRSASTQAIAGVAPSGDGDGSGLEAYYDDRLRGHPGAELRFGDRLVEKVSPRRGHSVRSTIRAGLTATAASALGGKTGGVAVLTPGGDVLALAGLAVSAPQPPGSTFKIVTAAAALDAGVAKLSSSYPVQTGTTLSGVRLANASNERCGGSLSTSFAESCNSVFAPLGAKLGAKRLVATAERFGFNREWKIPAAKPSTIPAASELPDSIAVGSAAIGQGKDLSTPLGMAVVGATIANKGRRPTPRIAEHEDRHRIRAVPASVARDVRTMMIGVVQGGTGRAGAVPGVQVAGKTGTAELRATGSGTPDPANTDAWFVAFAPATSPRVVVAVMLVGAGAGGAAAAPVARRVLQAAL